MQVSLNYFSSEFNPSNNIFFLEKHRFKAVIVSVVFILAKLGRWHAGCHGAVCFLSDLQLLSNTQCIHTVTPQHLVCCVSLLHIK